MNVHIRELALHTRFGDLSLVVLQHLKNFRLQQPQSEVMMGNMLVAGLELI